MAQLFSDDVDFIHVRHPIWRLVEVNMETFLTRSSWIAGASLLLMSTVAWGADSVDNSDMSLVVHGADIDNWSDFSLKNTLQAIIDTNVIEGDTTTPDELLATLLDGFLASSQFNEEMDASIPVTSVDCWRRTLPG